ncbi:MAG TPA: hypothetical protein VGB91_14600 [Rhizomicrobium sp.]
MRVKVQPIGEGLHPNETVVEIKTKRGVERMTVDRRSIERSSLSVGSPLGSDGDYRLVELPRETMTGAWRVWVKRGALIEDTFEAREARVA